MSLASTHTAAAALVRHLGDAGVSGDVRLELDSNGITITPASLASDLDWRVALVVIEQVVGGTRVVDFRGRTTLVFGDIDDVPVTATTPMRAEVVA